MSDRAAPSSYERALSALVESRVPFLVGGAWAIAVYCGIRRDTKDLDVFVRSRDLAAVLDALAHAGFVTGVPYPHWLAKARAADGEHVVDVIFNSGNGSAPVDEDWFAHAPRARVYGVDVAMVPAEETIWTKAFVMERERYDGADVAHVILACGASIDWTRLVRRFGRDWRVLFAHLVLFAYVFPDDAERVPRWVIESLCDRARTEPPASDRVCRGTLLSREQYLSDVASGWRDARLAPAGAMSEREIAIWTDAIERR